MAEAGKACCGLHKKGLPIYRQGDIKNLSLFSGEAEMHKRHLLPAAVLFLIAACSSDPAGFSIAGGPLQADEIPLTSYAPVTLSAQAFDVVSQDPNSPSAGVAGKVQPSPAEILSTYAANKFRAAGGSYNARFVIKQATLQVTQTAAPKKDDSFWSFGMFGGDEGKGEMSVNLSINVIASLPDGTGATITATTMQSEKISAGSPGDNRAAYVKLMGRALTALDGEVTRQLPVYFANIAMP
jgi:hypothetical protein